MTVFESLNKTTDKATDTAERYVKTSKEYFKLKVFQQLTLTLGLITKFAIVGGLIAFSLVFMGISGALAIGDELDSLPLGFLMIGVLFLILSLIVFLLKNAINSKIIKTIGDKYFEK